MELNLLSELLLSGQYLINLWSDTKNYAVVSLDVDSWLKELIFETKIVRTKMFHFHV